MNREDERSSDKEEKACSNEEGDDREKIHGSGGETM
jgi:hypothetical protein